MEINIHKQTAMAPAPFGMPLRARTGFGSGFGATGLGAGIATQGVLAFAVTAHVPGTSAWSPPIR